MTIHTLKNGDWLILGLIFLLFVASLISRSFQQEGNTAVVYVENRIVARLPLNQDQDFSIDGQIGKSSIRIGNGRVWMESSPCPHKICMQVGKIRLSGETIVCIPNRILIRILGKPHGLDGITM